MATTVHAAVWPLFCRTGAGLQVRLSAAHNSFADDPTMTVAFSDIKKPAGQSFEGLQPGQCGWPNRALSGAEKPCAVFTFTGTVPLNVDYDVAADGSLKPILRTWDPAAGNIAKLKDASGRKVKIYTEGRDGSCFKIVGDKSNWRVEFLN